MKTEKISREIEMDALLHKAWGLLGGDISLGSIWKFTNRASINEAKLLIVQSIKLDPKYPNNHRLLGLYYEARESANHLSMAKQCYDVAIKYDQEYALAYNNLGLIMVKLGKYSEAEVNYKSAIKYNEVCAEH